MTESQQKCFLAVSEHMSFSKAAEALYVSQPAVSKNISTLEEELGTVLFDRQGKFIRLTKAGEILHKFLMEYQRELAGALERIKALEQDGHSGAVRLGCGLSWNAGHFFPRLTRHFAIHYPGIQLEVEGYEPDSFIPPLRRKEVDILLMHSSDAENQPELVAHHLTELPIELVCSGSLFSGWAAELSVSNLRDIPFLVLENPTERRSNLYRDLIAQICAPYGFEPHFRSSRSMATAIMDVSCSKGALLMDSWSACRSNSEFRTIPTGEKMSICLAHLPTASDSLVSLAVAEILKVFQGNY